MTIDSYSDYDATGLAELVTKGDVTPLELADTAIALIEKHNPALNAVVHTFFERGREVAAAAPAGPFQGVPFLLKDIMGDLEGEPTTYASKLMAGLPAPHDSTLVARFKAAGLVPLAKTNVPEYGLLPVTEPNLYGPARNPWNLDHTPGGSSGGSAAAVAAGIVPMAHANDGGGSIRIPASCCGLVGLKPTRGRNPLGPDLGDVMNGLISEHVVTRSVRDCARLLDATQGPEPGDPYAAPPLEHALTEELKRGPGRLQIAWSAKTMGGIPNHPDCIAAVEETANLLADLGHIVEEAAPIVPEAVLNDAFMQVWAAGVAMQVDAFAMMTGRTIAEDELEPLTWGLVEAGRHVTASQYMMAIAQFQMMGRQMAQFMSAYDVWLTPTLGAPPLKIGAVDVNNSDAVAVFGPIHDYVCFTPIQNATGQPAITLPLHWNAAGLPIGLQFAGRFGDEGLLIRLAAQLEEAKPWADKRPPIFG